MLKVYPMEATFALFTCVFHSAQIQSFQLKYGSYDSLKILLSSRFVKNSVILKFFPI